MMNDYLDMSSYKSPLGGIPSALQMAHFATIKKNPDWMSSDNRFMYKQIMCFNKYCIEKKTPGLCPCVYSHSQDEFNMAWQLYHMNAGNLSVGLQYKQKEPPIDKSHPLWKKKILCQKCLADKPEPSCAYAHSDIEAAATAPAPAQAAAPIDKSNSSWRKQILCQKCPPNQPPKASCGYSHSCIEFEAAWSLIKQKQADEEKAQKEKKEQEEKEEKEKEEKAQKAKEAKAQKAKEAKEKKEQEEKEEQEEKAQKEKEEKAQKAKEAKAQKAKEAKEKKEQEEKEAKEKKEQEEKEAKEKKEQEEKEAKEKEEKAQKAKEARAQKAKEARAQKEAPPPPYEPQPPSPPPIVEDDNVSTTSTSSSSSKKKPAKEKIPSAVKRIVWNTYIGKDNLKGTCLCCNSEEVTVTNFECGHVKSEKNGGEVTVYNLRPICSNCNKSVGANDMDDFMKRYGISTPKNWNGLGGAAAATAATTAPKSKKDK